MFMGNGILTTLQRYFIVDRNNLFIIYLFIGFITCLSFQNRKPQVSCIEPSSALPYHNQ